MVATDEPPPPDRPAEPTHSCTTDSEVDAVSQQAPATTQEVVTAQASIANDVS